MNQELFEYFTTDNISGKKCTEKWLSKNNTLLYQSIIDWCSTIEILNNIEFKQKVYHYISNIEEIPTCLNCKGVVKYFRIRDMNIENKSEIYKRSQFGREDGIYIRLSDREIEDVVEDVNSAIEILKDFIELE